VLRQLLHGIVALLLWVVFVFYWSIVFQRPMSSDTRASLTTLAIVTGAGILFLSFWVYHNVRIHKKFRRRKRRRDASFLAEADHLGRVIVFEDFEALLRSHYIEVEVRTDDPSDPPVEEKIFKARRGLG
jgi:hypothetical protein